MMILWVFLGGGFGSVFRYLISYPINKKKLPFGTFVVNVTGAFLFGVLSSLISDNTLKLFLIVGFCGGYTTFSALANELTYIPKKKAIVYSILTTICGLSAVGFGSWLASFH